MDTENKLFLAIYQIPQSVVGWLPANPEIDMTLNYYTSYVSEAGLWTSVASDYHAGNVTFHDKETHAILLSDAFGPPVGSAHPIESGTSGRVEAIAVDWLSQNVYWVDEGYNWIKMTNYYRGHEATIVDTGLERPSGIACHPIKGYLFWTEMGNKYPPKIERSSMSGANRTTIVTAGLSEPKSIAVGITTDRIYWTGNSGADNKIESSDLNGDNRRTEVSEPTSDSVFDSISVDEVYIFVSVISPTLKHIIRYYNKSTPSSIVFQHTFSDDICVHDICVTGPNIQPMLTTLPCDLHTCSHLCASAADGKHECICGDNYVLYPNGTCSIDLNFWYPSRCIIGSTDAISLFSPTLIHSYSDNKQQYIRAITSTEIITALAVDVRRNLLFFAENTTKSIYVMRIEAGQEKRRLYTYTGGRVDGMAVDWISLKVYWVDYLQNFLMISSYDGTSQKAMCFNLIRPRAVAVDPNARLIFWTEQTSPTTKVVSCSLGDGGNRRDILNTQLLNPSGIALDHGNRRIYIVGEDSARIFSIDYDGIEKVNAIGFSTYPAKDITIFQDFIILVGSYGQQSGFIEAIHKVSDSREGRINVNNTVYAIDTFDESAQPIATKTATPTMTTTSHLNSTSHAQTTGSKFTLIVSGAFGALALSIVVLVVIIILLGKKQKRRLQQSRDTHGLTNNDNPRQLLQVSRQGDHIYDVPNIDEEPPKYESSIGAYGVNHPIGGGPYIVTKLDHRFNTPNTVAFYSKSEPVPHVVLGTPYVRNDYLCPQYTPEDPNEYPELRESRDVSRGGAVGAAAPHLCTQC
ncbi:low-density lipoprotein receptor-related protein 6-like isoform X2 [Anneissia japonica]|nr:low-density lipoprotein receptor-related protein 6-like isoform X2 [Anneissia japonica]